MEHPHAIPISDAVERPDGTLLTISGHITRVDTRRTHHGHPWALLTLTDDSGAVDVYVFPQHYAVTAALITAGAVVTVTGRLDRAPGQDGYVYGQDLHAHDFETGAAA